MDSDKHLTFIFIFMLLVMALFVGEVNNRALTERNRQRIENAQTKNVTANSAAQEKAKAFKDQD